MGVITIEVPQKVKKTFRIKSESRAKQIMDELGRLGKDTRGKQDDRELDAALDAVVGMWSYRKESTEEIARKLRTGWNRNNGK